MKKIRILSTRSLPKALVEKAEAFGIAIIQQEFISIRSLNTEETIQKVDLEIKRNNNLIFTSSNAVTAVADMLQKIDTVIENKNIFCISGRTKTNAIQSFPKNNFFGESFYGEGLAGEISESGYKQLVFFCGNLRRDELPQLLNKEGIELTEVVVYETKEAGGKTDDNFDGFLFFSPSAVDSFFRKNKLENDAAFFAIGHTTASALQNHHVKNIIVPSTPDPAHLLEKVIKHFNL